jgi:uncharacterized protein YycO
MNLTRSITAICLIVIGIAGCRSNSDKISLRPGDLLFSDSDCGPLCDAIEKVTKGYQGANLSHVGITANAANNRMIVIEAASKGVVTVDLQEFLNRNTDANGLPRIIVGRLKKPYRHLIPAAIKEAENLKGRPYDKKFEIGNDKYYCSELIYEIFRKANYGRPIFELKPMTFSDPQTGRILPVWRQYFAALGIDVPEGKLGINPGSISRSPVLDIIYISESVSKTR